MAFGPLIFAAITIAAAAYWLHNLTKNSAIDIDDLSPSERKVSLVYWNVGGKHRDYKVEIMRVFLKRDTVGEKHMYFEAFDANGKKRTFDAERVIQAFSKDGTELRQFNNYLRRIMAQNVEAQTFAIPQHQ